MKEDDFLRQLGLTALGTRLRRVLERLNGPVSQIYRERLGFEQRWFALVMLLGERGEVRIGDAAAALGISHVSIVQAVRELQAKGLAEKRADAADRRVSLVTLTEAGRDMLEQVGEVSRQVDRAAMALLATAAPDLLQSLDRLDDALEAEGFAARLAAMEGTDTEAAGA